MVKNDEFVGTDAIFSVKNVMDIVQCSFVEKALNWMMTQTWIQFKVLSLIYMVKSG